MESALSFIEKQQILPKPDAQWKRDEAAAKARKTGGFDDNYRYNPVGTESRDVFNKYILHGSHALHPEEYRRLQADVDVYGGFLVVPTEVSNYIFVDLDNALFIRQLATKNKVPHAETFSVPKLDGDFGNPT